jgi:peptidoglycan hydrolase-like protein with peptidoglycan-binding domain
VSGLVTPGRILLATVVATLAVFALVQDRGVASAAGRYVRLQQAAQQGRGPAVTVDGVMGPAVAASVRRALRWSGGVLVVGVGVGLGVAAAGVRGRAGR